MSNTWKRVNLRNFSQNLKIWRIRLGSTGIERRGREGEGEAGGGVMHVYATVTSELV